MTKVIHHEIRGKNLPQIPELAKEAPFQSAKTARGSKKTSKRFSGAPICSRISRFRTAIRRNRKRCSKGGADFILILPLLVIQLAWTMSVSI